ncbi:RNA polymerase sigma factor, partial [Longispora sp. NPDC051575]|uniref:RNA polymerase sigma factor n=1 Tax=Longispora sp. NPDC051575 TaxID=3154943 RepID=UPI003429A9BC
MDASRSNDEFPEFFGKHYAPLVGYLIKSGLGSEAEDVAQETFRKAYERWAELHTPRAWVYRVATRAALGRRGHEAKRGSWELRAVRGGWCAPASPVDPEEHAITRYDHDDLMSQLTRLPSRQRIGLVLYLDGHTNVEIAEFMGVAEATVRSQRRYALLKLRGDFPGQGKKVRPLDEMTARYPIITQQYLNPVPDRGFLGMGKKVRALDEVPKPHAHQVLVYRVGGRYVLDSSRLGMESEDVLAADHVTLVDVGRDRPVTVRLTIPSAEAADFTLQVTFVCTVNDAVRVVQNNL